jgi:hypothetical protein
MFNSGASNPSWSLGRRPAFFSYFGPQSIKNLRKIGQNTDFSLNSESSLGRRLDAPGLIVNFYIMIFLLNFSISDHLFIWILSFEQRSRLLLNTWEDSY